MFKNQDGKEYTRTELVRKPHVVEAYVKVRENRDEAWIRNFASPDDEAKEEMKKEKRRLQEQLRRIKRNQEKEKSSTLADSSKSTVQKQRKNAKLKKVADSNVRCGACGGKGHMRTNRACPKFVEDGLENEPINVAMTEKDEEELEKDLLQAEDTEELINVDGTKMRVSGRVLKHTEEVRKKTMILKVPKNTLKGGSAAAKRRRAGTVEHCDYLSNKNYRTKRRRVDPVISLASYLESVHAELRVMDEALQFLQPVNTKKVTDYLDKVKTPMDLQTIRENIQKKKYHSREDFLGDVRQIVENSEVYNGDGDLLTLSARKLWDLVVKRFSENEDKLMHLEKAINPLLDDNDQVALTHIFRTILDDKIKTMQESWPFMKPVNRKAMKHYYDVIKQPMDLETISQKITKHAYHSRQEFVHDIELIQNNSLEFNGPNSEYTLKAKKIVDVTNETLSQFSDHLSELEEKIKEVQARALESADMDSIGTSIDEQPPPRKRGRPRKRLVDDAGEDSNTMQSSNLDDDLHYTSDEDDDPDDDDWEPVGGGIEDDDEGVTVTIEPQEEIAGPNGTNYYQMEGGIQIEAPNVVIQQEVVEEEEEVDENYDPTDFLQDLANPAAAATTTTTADQVIENVVVQPGGEAINIEMPDIVNLPPPPPELQQQQPPEGESEQQQQPQPQQLMGALADDLDISDSDEEELDDKTVVAPPAPPLVPEPPPPDEDGIWF